MGDKDEWERPTFKEVGGAAVMEMTFDLPGLVGLV